MECIYKTRNGRFQFKVEFSTHQELFEQLAVIDELYQDLECTNGKDVSGEVNFVVRTDDDENKYYELQCVDKTKPQLMYSKKKFGVKKKGGYLFPKSKWVKYDKSKGEEVEL